MPLLSPADLLTTEFQARPLQEVLQSPPTALLGVPPAAATALGRIGVATVFDLAMSRVFGAATQLSGAAGDPTNPFNRFGAPASDLVSPEFVRTTRIEELRFLPVSILAGVPDDDAFADILGVRTVRDLAVYPPYHAARAILNGAFFPEADRSFDPEAPADLLPKSGEFPTERAQYTTLLLDSILRGEDAPPLVDLASPDFQPVDLSPVAAPDFAFRTIGLGALLTLNQSWFMQGVTLGHLLHSTALAPGESTRIAVVDWSRKSRAGQTESIAETEDLVNDTAHNRSITEVTQAVAEEAQSGFSSTKTESTSKQSGAGGGFALGGVIKGIGFSLGGGGTTSKASTSASAESYSTTAGRRDVAASLLQQVGDRTHQHAHAARTRRATVVKEVSQSEQERISTRVVANYNHMHALTVQYYEVLQLYRIETAVARADRAVFIPFQLADFTNEDVILRFRGALTEAALTRQIADALESFDTLEVKPDPETRFPVLGVSIRDLTANLTFFTARRPSGGNGSPAGPTVGGGGAVAREGGVAADTDAAAPAPGTPAEVATARPTVVRKPAASINAVREDVAIALWSDSAQRVSRLLGGGAVRRRSESLFVPADVKVAEAAVRGKSSRVLAPAFHRRDGTVLTEIDAAVPLSDIERITIRGSDPDADVDATVTLTLQRNGVFFPLELPAVTVPRGRDETRVVQIRAAGADANLVQHLQDNRLHYSQAAFRALDSAMLAGLLSNFSITLNGETVPVAQVVDPVPIRLVGNFLVFRIQADAEQDEEWRAFLDTRGIRLGQAKVDFVPLSSGGVFAEAVLGRFNSAEKLDLTRFWNWQDSPIPLQPSDIAAIQAGTRAQAENVAPGALSAPVVSIQQPTALPDPATTAGVLAALTNGALFRDLSGLAETVKLAQGAVTASSTGAGEAGKQAGANFQAALTAMTEIFKLKLGGGGKSAADASTSEKGAVVNEQDKRKQAGGAGAAAGNGAGGGSAGGGATGSTAGAGRAAGTGGGSGARSSASGNPALDVITFGPEGKPTDEAIRRSLGLDPDSPVPTPETSAEGVPLIDLAITGLYLRGIRDTFEDEPELLDAASERELIGLERWRPDHNHLGRLLNGPVVTMPSFGRLLRSLALRPAGTIRSLSIAGFAFSTRSVDFNESLTYSRLGDSWDRDAEDSPLALPSMTIDGLVTITGGGPIPVIDGVPVSLADVRNAFAENADVIVFNLQNPLEEDFIQLVANLFQTRATAFTRPVRLFAEEIAETAEDPPQLVTSVSIGFGFDGDPRGNTVDRLGQLLGDPAAFRAFPRRAVVPA